MGEGGHGDGGSTEDDVAVRQRTMEMVVARKMMWQ